MTAPWTTQKPCYISYFIILISSAAAVCLFVCTFLTLFVCRSVTLSVCLSFCQFVCLQDDGTGLAKRSAIIECSAQADAHHGTVCGFAHGSILWAQRKRIRFRTKTIRSSWSVHASCLTIHSLSLLDHWCLFSKITHQSGTQNPTLSIAGCWASHTLPSRYQPTTNSLLHDPR